MYIRNNEGFWDIKGTGIGYSLILIKFPFGSKEPELFSLPKRILKKDEDVNEKDSPFTIFHFPNSSNASPFLNNSPRLFYEIPAHIPFIIRNLSASSKLFSASSRVNLFFGNVSRTRVPQWEPH